MAKTPKDKSKKRAAHAAEPAEPYVVLARKYRPQSFRDLIGQEAMVRTLENAFRTGRIAQAYMLTGVRGVGKTTTARILARALNYERDGIDGPTTEIDEPGAHCEAIIASRHPDVLEMDAASNTGIDNVREIIENARYRPISARTKVFIIDEVHMLSRGAFNALLKTLEEPPEHVKFIFATTEIRKVPVTVLSRCQRFDLRRVDGETLTAHFARIAEAEGATAEPQALALISRASQGSVRDGLSILDQALAVGDGNVTADVIREMLGLADRGRIFDLLEILLAGDPAGALGAFDTLMRDGADPAQLLGDLAEAAHIVTRAKITGPEGAGEALSGEERTRAGTLAEKLNVPQLSRLWQMLIKGHSDTVAAGDARAAAEMVLIRVAYAAELPPPGDLARRIADLESGSTAAASNGAQSQSESPPTQPQASAATSKFATFEDLVAFIGERRDVNLKIELEERVRLVRYQHRRIEVQLEETARSGLLQDFKRKLDQWTGETWVVASLNEGGGATLKEQRLERVAAEISAVQDTALLKQTLEEFPGAEIVEVRPIPSDEENVAPGDSESAKEQSP